MWSAKDNTSVCFILSEKFTPDFDLSSAFFLSILFIYFFFRWFFVGAFLFFFFFNLLRVHDFIVGIEMWREIINQAITILKLYAPFTVHTSIAFYLKWIMRYLFCCSSSGFFVFRSPLIFQLKIHHEKYPQAKFKCKF